MGKRVISRRRGAGGIYSAPSHLYKANVRYPNIESGEGLVKDIIHDPGHTVPLIKVDFANGLHTFLLAPETIKTEQNITIGANAAPVIGNILQLMNIPEGTRIFNIEARPTDGGKFVRSAGTSATIITHSSADKTIVQLPSGKMRAMNSHCRATIGIAAGGGRTDKPWGKAGKRYHALRSKAKVYPQVSGVAMCPVYHPHGGGSHQHVGKPSCVARGAPPGRKVGKIAPKRTGRRKG